MTTSIISDSLSHADKRLLIDADAITVNLGNVLALEAISLCVHAGEFIGLIGPNGAGKSTLLKVLLGLILPDQGSVRREKAIYEYVPQRGNMYSGITPLSVLEIVKLGSKGDVHMAKDALQTAQIEELAKRRFDELSGGQQQRVALAKALAAKADMLILDEPTTGIDSQSQQQFYDILGRLQAKGITIIMVSHEVEAVLNLVTRVVCLNRSILYDGTPEHFEADMYMPRLYDNQHRQLHHNHEAPHA